MKIDLAALTMGLSAAAPGASAKVPAIGSQVGKRTADSPFAVLLASAVPGRWSEGSSGAAAAPPGAEPALVTLGLGAAKARQAAAGQVGRGARRGELQDPAQPATPPVKADPGAGTEATNHLVGQAPPTMLTEQAQGATGAARAQLEEPVVEVQEAVESQPLPAQAPSPSPGGEGAALAAQASMAALLQVTRPSPTTRPSSPVRAAAQGATSGPGMVATLASSGASPLARTGVPVAQGAPAGSADPAGAADVVATQRVPTAGPMAPQAPAIEPRTRIGRPGQAGVAPAPQDSKAVRAPMVQGPAAQAGAAQTQAAADARVGTVRAQATPQDGNVTATDAKTRGEHRADERRSARLAAPPPAQPDLRAAAPRPPGRPPLQAERASAFPPPASIPAQIAAAPKTADGAPALMGPRAGPQAPVSATPEISPHSPVRPAPAPQLQPSVAAPAPAPQAPAPAASAARSTPGQSLASPAAAAAEAGATASAAQAEPPLEQARADARASRREEAGRRSTEPVAVPRRGATTDRPAAPAQRQAAAPEAATRPAATAFVARDLSTSARLTQASRAGQPLPDAGEPQRARTSRPAGEQLPQHAAPLQAQPPAPESAAPKAAAPVHRPAPVAQEPLQTGVTGTILPAGAHLKLESETLGDLALHLRIRDGVAHLRVEGEQASALAGHGHELQRALAAEGLQLGKLELDRPQPQAPQPAEASRGPSDQSLTQGQRERPEQGEPGGAAGHAPGASTSPQGRRPQGRTTAHHVEA